MPWSRFGTTEAIRKIELAKIQTTRAEASIQLKRLHALQSYLFIYPSAKSINRPTRNYEKPTIHLR